jgi:hypothetical protein
MHNQLSADACAGIDSANSAQIIALFNTLVYLVCVGLVIASDIAVIW